MYLINICDIDVMGVRRLFSRGGQKFSRGARTYFSPKKQQKRYYFSPKSLKTYYFWPALASQGGGGKSPPLPSPADAHDRCPIYLPHFLSLQSF